VPQLRVEAPQPPPAPGVPQLHVEAQEFTATFNGVLGIRYYTDAGVIIDVTTGGAAERAGVRKDMQIRSIDGRPYTKELFVTRAAQKNCVVGFSKALLSEDQKSMMKHFPGLWTTIGCKSAEYLVTHVESTNLKSFYSCRRQDGRTFPIEVDFENGFVVWGEPGSFGTWLEEFVADPSTVRWCAKEDAFKGKEFARYIWKKHEVAGLPLTPIPGAAPSSSSWQPAMEHDQATNQQVDRRPDPGAQDVNQAPWWMKVHGTWHDENGNFIYDVSRKPTKDRKGQEMLLVTRYQCENSQVVNPAYYTMTLNTKMQRQSECLHHLVS
jgi:hypothetical protein